MSRVKCRAGCDVFYSSRQTERDHHNADHLHIKFECKKCSKQFDRTNRFYEHCSKGSICDSAKYQRVQIQQETIKVVVKPTFAEDPVKENLEQFLSFKKPTSGIFRK